MMAEDEKLKNAMKKYYLHAHAQSDPPSESDRTTAQHYADMLLVDWKKKGLKAKLAYDIFIAERNDCHACMIDAGWTWANMPMRLGIYFESDEGADAFICFEHLDEARAALENPGFTIEVSDETSD